MSKLPSPAQIKEEWPLTPKAAQFIVSARKCASQIVEQKDTRIACIIGPCSIHDPKSALEYAKRLKKLSNEIEESIFIVMRVYIEKSRSGDGWKGYLYDPTLDGSYRTIDGLIATRELLLNLAELGIPAASEFVDPIAAVYYQDLITWGFIGARTAASQPHRQLASGFQFPIGFKNTVFGEINAPIQAIQSAQQPQHYLSIDENGCAATAQSSGNPLTHLVLRGSNANTNFDRDSIQRALDLLSENNLQHRLMIDCSHGNSGKDHRKQKIAFNSVIDQILDGRQEIFGLMLESHLYAGRQIHSENLTSLRYGLSITDPCIGWEETELWLLDAFRLLSPTLMSSVQK